MSQEVSSSRSGAAGTVSPAAALVEPDDAFVQEERALDVLRLRLVLSVELALCLAIAWVPVAAALTGASGLADRVVAIVLSAAAIGAALQIVRGPSPTDRALDLATLLAFILPAAGVAVIAARTQGIVSPIAHADLVLLTAYALALPRPWRRAWPVLAAITLSWPVIVLASCGLDPDLRAQLDDPRLRADFQETALAIAVGALLAGAGQDIQWSIRRSWLSLRRARAYRIEGVLGEGGMGIVYRATHPTLGRAVALKKLSKAAEPDMAARFVREVRATAQLTHPNIVRILDCGVTGDGEPFYTMELLTGATLARLVEAEGPLTPERATFLVAHAARALAEAHRRGLVHRDVKPENLFVATEGGEHDVLKVLDFGIAKSLLGDGSVTAEGALIGTPRYMAPEQALGETIDARTDVYALGGALYFALTGRAPVDEPTVFAVLAAHAAGTIVPVGVLRPSLPDGLQAIVARCLLTDRAQRFADGAELADALDATGLPASHRPVPSEIVEAGSGAPSASGLRTKERAEPDAVTRVARG